MALVPEDADKVNNSSVAVLPSTATITKATAMNPTTSSTTIADIPATDAIYETPAQDLAAENANVLQSKDAATLTGMTTPSKTPRPLPSGGLTSVPTEKPLSTDFNSAPKDDTRDGNNAADDSAALIEDASEIASDVQERSQINDTNSQSSEQDDGERTEALQYPTLQAGSTGAGAVASAVPATSGASLRMSTAPRRPSNTEDNPTVEASRGFTTANATIPLTTNTSVAAPAPTLAPYTEETSNPEESQPSEDASSESTASYTSPHHEWARILQRRLGKGLTDAQLLARSNSMLASPSILAQSLNQVIPSLQVKETLGASPGSSAREYQTAEELFDRPAMIEPSQPTVNYDDPFSRDDSFPSSAFTRNSQVPLLLFAPLNPDQLHRNSTSVTQPPAPSPSAEAPAAVKQPQPQPAPSHQQQHQPAPALLTSVPQPVVPPPAPIPIPPIAVASSPASRTHVVSPSAVDLRSSPLISREPGPGSRNVRQSLVIHQQGQEERPGLISHGASSRTLLGQGSSSSLTGAPVSSGIKDSHTSGTLNYPVAPIQYTPVTQYKANTPKEGSRSNKKARDTINAAKEATAPVESPEKLSADVVAKDSLPPTASTSAAPSGATATKSLSDSAVATLETKTDDPSKNPGRAATPVDGTAQWALEALSGFADVNFDTTLPVSLAVATTIATSSQSTDPSTKLPILNPPTSSGTKTNVGIVEASPKVITKIPSPFESAQITVEFPKPASPELKSQTLQAPTSADAYMVTATQPLSAPIVVAPTLPVVHQAATGVHANHSAFELSASTSGQHSGTHKSHQANRSISGLRDSQAFNMLVERVSQDHGQSRKNELDMTDPCLQFKHIGEAIRHWGQYAPEGNAFANLDGKGIECGSWDWAFALGRAEMIARAIHDKTQLRTGARVALVFRLSEVMEFVAAFFGAILAGVVPVLVNQIQDFSEMVYIMTSTKVELALTTQFNHKSLQKDLRKGAAWPANVTWWQTDILETWAPKNSQERLPLANNDLAYIEYTKSATGELKGVAISHKNLISQCQVLYSSFSWRPALFRDKNGNYQTDPNLASTESSGPSSKDRKKPTHHSFPGTVMTWLEPRQQAGLTLGCIMGAFCGNFTVFMESGITAVSGLWAHSVAAYRCNIAFADYIGIRKLLRNFRINPQATITPTRPDLRFLRTVYVDTQSNNPVLNREFLDDFLYPLGMISRQDPLFNGVAASAASLENSSSSTPNSKPKMVRSDVGVIAFLSLLEHGGMIVALRDTLNPPLDAEKVDLRKQYRKSTLPPARRPSAAATQESDPTEPVTLGSTEHRLPPPGSDLSSKNDTSSQQDSLLNHPSSSLASGEYLLHRGALRSNRIAVLATGDEAYRRRDEPGAILVGAFGYPLAQLGEIWVSSSGMPVGFWGLPEHTLEIFNAKSYIVTEDTMIPTVFSPRGCEQLLRTGLLGTIIEGRVIILGPYLDRLQQDMADPLKPIGTQFESHHCSDLIKTLLNHVGGIGEVSIFECLVNKEHLPVVCIELSRDCRWHGQSINAVAQQVAVNSRHYLKEVNGLRSFSVAVWDTNTLPRIFQNGWRVIDHALCKKMFELGRIYKMLYFATYTEDVLFNVPYGDDIVNGFWSRESAVKRQRRQEAPVRYVQYTSNIANPDAYDEKTGVFMGKFHSITDILIWRSIIQPDEVAFVEIDSRGKEQKTIPFKKFNQRVTSCAMHLDKKHGLKAGDHVLLWFAQDLDYIITLHACWVLGLIPIPLPLPDNAQPGQQSSLPSHLSGGHAAAQSMVGFGVGINSSFTAGPNGAHTNTPANPTFSAKAIEDRRNGILRALLRIMDEVKVKAILGNTTTDDYLKQKSTGAQIRNCRTTFTANYQQTPDMFNSPDIALPTFCNVSKAPKTKQTLGALSGYAPRKEWFAANYPAVYLIDPEAKVGSISSKKLLKLNHETLNNLCRNQKLQFQTLTGQPVVPGMSIFYGLGFVHGCLCGMYNGGPTVILQPVDFLANPVVWLEVVSRYKAQDVVLTYPLLDQLLSRLDGTHGAPPALGAVYLDSVKNFMVCGHGRIQREKNLTMIARLAPLKLEANALNLAYSHPLNPMVTSQVDRAAGAVRIHVSSRSLRTGIVSLTSEGEDPTGIWLEDVGIPTVCTSIAIVHPETFEVCPANQIGEIWVCSDASINSFHIPAGFVSNPSHPQPFNACITGYDSRVKYVRTGDLGFLWNGQQHHLLQRQHSLSQQGQWSTAQAGSGSFPLFVLGSLEDSFQMHGLLHFSVDIEATVESSHANVAQQGCVTFKTVQGQVVCVVKVQSQEPEVLVSMYIPVMHAILEQHQFLPDTIVLVGETVATARRLADGIKPRETICNLYISERLPILHLHHCHGKPLAPVSSALLPPIHDKPPPESSTTTPPNMSSHMATPVAQQQNPAALAAAQSSARFVNGVSPAPMVVNRGPLHLGLNHGSPGEPSFINLGSSRNSLYGSPLLVSNVPLPPGALNPMLQSPMTYSPVSVAVYHPQTQYQPGGYIPVVLSTAATGPLVATAPSYLPVQQTSMPSLASNLPSNSTSYMSAAAAAALSVPRPMSLQAFASDSSYGPTSSAGGIGVLNANGTGNSGSSGANSNVSPLGEAAPFAGQLGTSNSVRGVSSEGRTRQQQQHQQQRPTQQLSQPQLVQQSGQRPTHPRQFQGQEARSLSSEELRLESSKPGGAVKNIMKGMNAKWSEIRKAGSGMN
ncbi:hypothetical protein BGZ99_007223 [Dissophora globulifera]|uniref:AMP-dependent synthetase/ligase domain-containing protein n=1 Tax=Dissophora globulifera TaxID=979702 RepID=A0A9P6UZN4_9FUNG|nr:hypothetical protein BGZ99_007223 [Dissophora globulifera]